MSTSAAKGPPAMAEPASDLVGVAGWDADTDADTGTDMAAGSGAGAGAGVGREGHSIVKSPRSSPSSSTPRDTAR